MSQTCKDWRNYQEAAARVFRRLGCQAEVEKTVNGARASHTVDVYVTFSQFGHPCRWIVECKLMSRPAKKADVLTLDGVVRDVGADRGLLFCESGFQAGAYKAARLTNVALQPSLDDFMRQARLAQYRVPLALVESSEPDAPPVHILPDGYQPHDLLNHGGRLFVSNWGSPSAGNIAIIDPDSRALESVIELDRYEDRRRGGGTIVRQHPPGNVVCADGRVFVGQVFSDVVLAIDIESQSIVKRIDVPGGGEGHMAASSDGRHVYFASNRTPAVFAIDSGTYRCRTIEYPREGRGCLCALAHPTKPLLYLGIQRTRRNGGCFLAVYDLIREGYVGLLNLSEMHNGQRDASSPICLTYDEGASCIYVGMFQSRRGICRVDEYGTRILDEIRFEPNATNAHFRWVDPLSQTLYGGTLLTVNRNTRELVEIEKASGQITRRTYLGDAPNGPRAVVMHNDEAIISYPEREGLIFLNLAAPSDDRLAKDAMGDRDQ